MASFVKRLLVLLLLPLYIGLAAPTQAQPYDGVPGVTRAFAIENARIVQAPGRVLERGTVVVRNGLIEAVGTNVEVPYDAERIAGDSLTVYAGFIDGLSHTALPKPKEEEGQGGFGSRPDVEDPGNPPNDVAGIQPERRASDLVKADEASIEALRKVGFAAAHVVPQGGLLPGSGAVVLLTGGDGKTMILQEDASLVAQFEGAPGVYPATPMGIMAKLRTLYREAERRQRGEKLYATNAVGMERPTYDPVYEAFFPVIDGEQPVFFYAEGALDARRALTLQRDLGFPLVLAGLAEGFAMTEALKEADVPLLLTLSLPEDPDAKADSAAADSSGVPSDSTAAPPDSSVAPTDSSLAVAGDSLAAAPDQEKAVTPEAPSSTFVRDYRTRSYEDVGGEDENLKARQRMAREQYYATAATLHEAGLAFGFTAWDVKPADVRKNLRLMIENGLPEDAALAALTTDAADILGLADRLGTVDNGKIANLVVTDAPYFDEESKVRYVFVDGQQFEIEEEAEASGDEAADPTGTWSFTVSIPDGDTEDTGDEVTGTLTLTGSPDDLSGTLTSAALTGSATLEQIELDGSALTFSFDTDEYGRVEAALTLEGDSFEGTLDVSGETYPIEGTRTSGPDGS